MHKLYEVMKKIQGKCLSIWPAKPILNLKEEIKFITDYFEKIEKHPKFLDTFIKDSNIFPTTNENSEYYANTIANTYNLCKKQVQEWIDDKRYENLRNQTMSFVPLPAILDKKLKEKLINIFSFRDDLNTLLCTQRPGQMSALHYDRKKDIDFGLECKEERKIKRYIIFLHDQKEGQIFYIGGHLINWKAGDVFSWQQTGYQHGDANFGYYERPAIVVTGVKI